MKQVITYVSRKPSVRAVLWAENPYDPETPLTRQETAKTIAAIALMPGGIMLVPAGRLAEHTARQHPHLAHSVMQQWTAVQSLVAAIL